MNPAILKTIHLLAVMGLFTALGSILLANSAKKSASMLHGISLLLLLLVGFAILKKPPMDQSWWMIKVGLWLFLGAAPVLAKRNILPNWLVLTLALAAGFLAAWLGVMKSLPF